MDELKDITKELLKSTTIHGIPNIVESRHYSLRIMWVVFSLVSAGVCISFIVRTIGDFNEHSVITNIDVIYEQESQFPTVSFCVSNTSFYPNINPRYLIIGCFFDHNNCSWKDFEIYNSIQNEICFKYNSGKNYYNHQVEILNTRFSDVTRGLLLILKINTSNLYGFKATVFVQNHSNIFAKENLFKNETGVLLTAGNSYITIQREFVEKLDLPYNNCTKQEKLSKKLPYENFFLTNNKTYTQKDCIDLCLKRDITKKCKCRTKSIDPYAIYKSCYLNSNETIRNCTLEYFEKYLVNKKTFIQKCLKKCPLECDSVNYRISSHYLGSVTSELFFFLKSRLDLESDLANVDLNNLVIFSVFYDDLKYTSIKQIPKVETFDLISNIGGTLGLFLGFSFLSLVEVFQLIYLFIFYLIKKLTFMML